MIVNTHMSSASPLLGHVPIFTRDPLGFFTDCSRCRGDWAPLRFGIKQFFAAIPPTSSKLCLRLPGARNGNIGHGARSFARASALYSSGPSIKPA